MQFNQYVLDTDFPPVTEAASWIANRTFPAALPLIDVSQAVPGYSTSADVLNHMATVLIEGKAGKYGHALGLPELRYAYASSLHSNVKSDQVAITAGCNQAFYVAVTALCEPGDNVLLPLPWYFNHKMTLDTLGIEAQSLSCDPENRLLPDLENAKRMINHRTRAIVLISPNNPTGQVYPPALIDAYYQLAEASGITLIVDETYRDFRPENETPPHQIFNHPNWFEHVVHLYSFSKSYALAGYRVGALVGSSALLNEVTKILDSVAICAPQLSQYGALFGLTHANTWKEEKRVLMQRRAIAFETAMAANESSYEVAAIGAYFAYLKHPHNTKDSTRVARFLADNANLLCLPGAMFGPGQDRYLRVAFANVAEEKMPEIPKRLARFID